jgi:hypothetical protein
MASFHRVDTSKLVRGAARIMYAPSTQAEPEKIADVIDLSTFDAMSGWFDLGATREGIQITLNNSEDAFEVDQVQGEVGSAPNAWECAVQTRLAEITLEHFVFIWEGANISTDTSIPSPYERETGFAGATSYTERRLAVLFQRPSGKLQAYLFHKAVRSPQEGVIDFRKGGDAMSIQIRFRIIADPSQTDPLKQFFIIREQI